MDHLTWKAKKSRYPLLKVKRIRHPVWSVRDSSNLVDLYERYHKTIIGSVSTTAESRRNAWSSLRSDFLHTVPEHNREVEHIQTKIANIKDDVRKYLKAVHRNETSGGSPPPDPHGYIVRMYNIVHRSDDTRHVTAPSSCPSSPQPMYSVAQESDNTHQVTNPTACPSPPQTMYSVAQESDNTHQVTNPTACSSPPQPKMYSVAQESDRASFVKTSTAFQSKLWANHSFQINESSQHTDFDIKKEIQDQEQPANTLEVHQMQLIAEQRYLAYLQTLKVQHELKEKAIEFYSFSQFSKGTGMI